MNEIDKNWTTQPTERYWYRHAKEALPDLRFEIIELITNSVDSYIRSNKPKPYRIEIEYSKRQRKCIIRDFAEGMSFDKIREVTKGYGAATSGIESGKQVRGHFGVGLKDVAAVSDELHIISLKDGKISHVVGMLIKGRGIDWRPVIIEDASEEKLHELGFENEASGTIVELKVAEDYVVNFNKLINQLYLSYPLRRIFMYNEEFKISLLDLDNVTPPVQLSWQKGVGETGLEGNIKLNERFDILYNNRKYKANIRVYATQEKLSGAIKGVERLNGLLVTYNKVVIVDCTLFGFDHDPIAQNLFGELEIPGLPELLKKDEPIITENRRFGLDMQHPFVKELKAKVEKYLKDIIDSEKAAEEGSNLSVFRNNRDLINWIKKKAAEELTGGEKIPRLYVPEDGFSFYRKQLYIKEKEKENVFFSIDREVVEENAEIKIISDKEGVDIKPFLIKVGQTEGKKRTVNGSIIIDYKISIETTLKPKDTFKVSATYKDKISKLIVTVEPNEKLSILEKNDIGFFPNKATVSPGETNKVRLYVPSSLIGSNKEKVGFFVENDLIELEKNEVPYTKFTDYIEGIKLLEIKIRAKENAKINEKSYILARLGNKEAKLEVEIVNPIERSTKGFVSNILYNPKECGNELAIYKKEGESGIIYVNNEHPILEFYKLDKKGLNIIVADAVLRIICEIFATGGYNPSKIPQLSESKSILDSYSIIKEEIAEKYFRLGKEWHRLADKTINRILTR